jgi:hypothetical protein
MASSKSTSWYSDMNWILKLILTIIPVTGWLMGGIVRILRGIDNGNTLELVLGIVYLVTGAYCGIGWILDIITTIINHDIYVILK